MVGWVLNLLGLRALWDLDLELRRARKRESLREAQEENQRGRDTWEKQGVTKYQTLPGNHVR